MRDGECDGLSSFLLRAQKGVTFHGFVIIVSGNESKDFGIVGVVGAKGNPINGYFFEQSPRIHFRHTNSARRNQNLHLNEFILLASDDSTANQVGDLAASRSAAIPTAELDVGHGNDLLDGGGGRPFAIWVVHDHVSQVFQKENEPVLNRIFDRGPIFLQFFMSMYVG